MWLRDLLPVRSEIANIYLHGYDSPLNNSTSFESIRDLATTLRSHIQHVLGGSTRVTSIDSQAAHFVVLLGHSLGGVIIKEVCENLVLD